MEMREKTKAFHAASLYDFLDAAQAHQQANDSWSCASPLIANKRPSDDSTTRIASFAHSYRLGRGEVGDGRAVVGTRLSFKPQHG